MMAEALHLSERRTFSYHMEAGVEGLHERAGLRSSRTRVVAAEHALVDLLHVLARRVTVDRDLGESTLLCSPSYNSSYNSPFK
jgi:hypothetical protein